MQELGVLCAFVIRKTNFPPAFIMHGVPHWSESSSSFTHNFPHPRRGNRTRVIPLKDLSLMEMLWWWSFLFRSFAAEVTYVNAARFSHKEAERNKKVEATFDVKRAVWYGCFPLERSTKRLQHSEHCAFFKEHKHLIPFVPFVGGYLTFVAALVVLRFY